jgi:tetratricopeptide (TPR) repeat protein/tRNA A-37 threonylcarbamoyl transferase component Bud32/TolB-like protein
VIGQTVSHYRITGELGAGGMGVVYRAVDTKLDRPVALKFLPPDLTRDAEAKRRFVHEAKAASALQHHNICTIHEIDETDDGRMFICMDCYEGETLRQMISERPIPVDKAIHILIQAAEGLAKAHEAGMVHRDVKSANLMVTTDGVLKILDFGLAKLAGQTKVTKMGTTVGTVAYMSPEQARGEVIDHRTDIWSLGVVLFEMLSGHLPFSGEHEQAVFYQVLHEDPARVTALRAEIPAELEHIVDKCLAKSPDDRYQDAGELVVDLCNLIGESPPRAARRKKMVKRAALVLTVLIVATIASIVLRQFRGVPPAEAVAVAVVDFRDLRNPDDATASAGITNLVHVGLVESSPCRVVSSQLLYDLRRRLFGAGRGPIEEDQAMEVTRRAGASMFVSGQMILSGSTPCVTWQLVDIRSGETLSARRVEGGNLAVMADQIIAGVLPLIAKECGVEEPSISPPVSEMTTASPEAYTHYTAGLLALEERKNEDAVREFQRAVQLDSTFALAYYELSKIYFNMLGGAPEHEPTHRSAEKAWKYRANLGIKDRLYIESWREQLHGRAPDAIAILREMLTRWPDDKEILDQLSRTLFYYWHLDEAAAVARRGLELYPDEWWFVYLYANSVGTIGRPGDAVEVSRSFAERHPRDANAWRGVAKWALAMGSPDSAEAACRRALEIEPDMLYARRYIIFCDYFRGNLERAIENSERLLERSDLVPGQRIGLIIGDWYEPTLPMLYAETGRFRKALQVYDRAGQLASDLESKNTVELRRNNILLRIGRNEEVLQRARDLSMRSKSRQNRATAVRMQARALAALDSLEAARSMLAQSEALASPTRAVLFPTLKVRAEIELAEKNPEAALATLDSMQQLGLSPKAGWWHIEWREARARAYRMAGRLDEAARVHEDMLRLYRGHTLSHYDLGQIYEEMGRPVDAERHYAAFVEAWSEADDGLPRVEDAGRRLAALQLGSRIQ